MFPVHLALKWDQQFSESTRVWQSITNVLGNKVDIFLHSDYDKDLPVSHIYSTWALLFELTQETFFLLLNSRKMILEW